MVTTFLEGGIGNQIFMLSQLLAHSLKYNLDYCVPKKIHNPHYAGQKPYIFPGIHYCETPLDLPLYIEKEFKYNEIPFVDNVCFKGYWQSHLYSQDYREEILKALGLPWEMKRGVVSLHKRLGDYKKFPNHHPVISVQYVEQAILYFNKRGYNKFLVFSDDIDWCYENINKNKFPDCEFEYSEGRTEIEDLVLGSECEHQIGSNSTFSLQQHFLNRNPDKTCVLPKNWFGAALGHHDTSTLYPPTSIIF